MSTTDLVAPISLSDGNDIKLSHSDGTLDGSLDLFVTFPAETKIVSLITNNGVGFEAGPLTGLSLLLDGFDFHHFFFDVITEEGVYDFLLLDGDRESEDINDVLDFFALDQSSEFGDWLPLDLFFLSFGTLSTLFISGSAESSSFFGLGCFLSRWCLRGYFSHKWI